MRAASRLPRGRSRSGNRIAGGAIAQLQESLTLLQGCFYGLSGRERRVLNMRAGLDGPARSRSYVAHRLGTTRGKVRGIEQNALFTLQGLADSTGLRERPRGGGRGRGRVYLIAGRAGPGAAAGHAGRSRLPGRGPVSVQPARRRTAVRIGPARIGASAEAPSGSSLWALQLLLVMLALGLVGLVRGGPALAGWLRLKRESLPARPVSARSPEPAPRPVHRHGQIQVPAREGARPRRRQIPS